MNYLPREKETTSSSATPRARRAVCGEAAARRAVSLWVLPAKDPKTSFCGSKNECQRDSHAEKERRDASRETLVGYP